MSADVIQLFAHGLSSNEGAQIVMICLKYTLNNKSLFEFLSIGTEFMKCIDISKKLFAALYLGASTLLHLLSNII